MQFLHKKATSETGQDLQLPLWWNQFMLQLNLCEKLLFLHPLTHKMTTDCSLNYKFKTWKFQAQIWGENVVYRNCFWYSEQFLYTTCSPHVLQKEELLTKIYLYPKMFLELNCNIKPRDELIACYIQYSWICIVPNVDYSKVRVISWIKYSNHEWYRVVSYFSKSLTYL